MLAYYVGGGRRGKNWFMSVQWNPSIVATIGERPSGLYRGVATSQGFYMMALCACAYECLAAPSRPSPISRLFHAGCTSS